MTGYSLPGYDTWKLASPYDDLSACPACYGSGKDRDRLRASIKAAPTDRKLLPPRVYGKPLKLIPVDCYYCHGDGEVGSYERREWSKY